MARYERRQNLHSIIQSTSSQVQDTQAAFAYTATRKWTPAATTVNSTTPSVTVVSEYVNCNDTGLLEVYAHGLGTTNGAGKYGALVVYIDGNKMYADSLLQWGSASAAVTTERRFSYPSAKLGSLDRLGGFVVVWDANTNPLSAGAHLIEVTIETVGTGASCTASDLLIAYRIS
jgi:hypothetical protein